jgi:hypothetical protein
MSKYNIENLKNQDICKINVIYHQKLLDILENVVFY